MHLCLFYCLLLFSLSPCQMDLPFDASQRKFSTCVQLAFRLVTTWTCDDLRWLWWSSNPHSRFSTFGHPTQLGWSQVICISVKFTTFSDWMNLRELANPFGHPSQVRTQVLVLQTCVDLFIRTCIFPLNNSNSRKRNQNIAFSVSMFDGRFLFRYHVNKTRWK